MCVVTKKFIERMQLRNHLQVETCSMYTLNVNFEKLNFGPHKNDYTMFLHYHVCCKMTVRDSLSSAWNCCRNSQIKFEHRINY
jgi:hypothetical protein